MSETLRMFGFGLTGAFIIISYFAAIILAFVWLRAREAAAMPAGQFQKFKSSCGVAHTPAVEGAGRDVCLSGVTGPHLSEPVDLGINAFGILTQGQVDALEFRSVEIDFENDGRFPHFALTEGGQTVITVDPTRWRK